MMAFRAGQVLLVVAFAAMAVVAHSSDHSVFFGGLGSPADAGLISSALDNDFLMESETGRRQLAASAGYISYGALRRNTVPCNQRGQSYYGCRSHQKANPYSRGCTRATMCARNNR